jgi:hypothetical protein
MVASLILWVAVSNSFVQDGDNDIGRQKSEAIVW